MNSDSIRRVVAEIAYRRARFYHQTQSLPRLIVVYVYRRSETRSLHGLVIEGVYFVVGAKEIPVPLGIKGLAIVDVLARHKPRLLSAAQIEDILRTDPVCYRLGSRRLMNRRFVTIYVHRVRTQLARALDKEDITVDPKRLLVADHTELANVSAYRLAIPCKIVCRES
jgi:hypothetical protein